MTAFLRTQTTVLGAALEEPVNDSSPTSPESPETVNPPVAIPADVVTGVARGEIEARAVEHAKEGLRQVGQAEVVSVTLVSTDEEATPPTMTVEACLDLSPIDLLDRDGRSLRDRLYDPGHPVRDVYTLVWLDGSWQVTFHEVPPDDTCTPTAP